MEMLRLPAIETQQGTRKIYTFSVDGKQIDSFATVSRVARNGLDLSGYQRPEQRSHVSEICAYIDSRGSLVPNAIVIAFDRRVRFEPSEGGPASSYSRTGHLAIPVDEAAEMHERPGFIVDGQQRVAALREARRRRYPIHVTAFIAKGIHEQLEQFILVNATKPLPRGLIYELIPNAEGLLPLALERRRLPALLVTLLNERRDSPLYHVVRTATNPEGRIKDNSILKALQNSLSDGVLYSLRGNDGEEHDLDRMVAVAGAFFEAVQDVFPEAWALPPKQSRLTHGAGIVALGSIMDATGSRVGGLPSKHDFKSDLGKLEAACHWTSGEWDLPTGEVVAWDKLQNTTAHTEALVRYFGEQYRRRVLGRRRSRRRE